MLIAIMHLIVYACDHPYGIVGQLMAAVPGLGSYLALSQVASDIEAERMAEAARRDNRLAHETQRHRTHEEVSHFFDGLDLVEPGVVAVHEWRPGPETAAIGYLRRHNPLRPLEMDLARSDKLPYRLYLYLRRQWTLAERHDRRDVYSLVGANMSFRRPHLRAMEFDERFAFGGEDFDLCRRLLREFPAGRLVVTPNACVKHHFRPSLSDTLRRSRAYGRGSARLYRKWPSLRPTFFPGPMLVAGDDSRLGLASCASHRSR